MKVKSAGARSPGSKPKDAMSIKMQALMDLLSENGAAMAGELRGKFAPQIEMEVEGESEGAPVVKAGVTGPSGSEEQEDEPSLLLKDMDQDAIRRLLGE